MISISAPELANWLADANRQPPVLLDVRELSELQHCQIPASLHIPMHSVPPRMNELDSAAAIVCICHHGARSMQVARFLKQHDFEHVINLTGGIHAWAVQVDTTMETY
ncbi:rhodanese-like domain-containing protein [Solimicrobium silvestre]|uniref:rhodanese-like domain-containing protein n=1 Tax=Solimicrobium silvestre TaxID=2099400 RepID=UPI000CFC6F1B